MRRRLLLGTLALGTIVGYASMFVGHRHFHSAHSGWQERVADACVQAAKRQEGTVRSGSSEP